MDETRADLLENMIEICQLYTNGHLTHRIQAKEARKEALVPVDLSPVSLGELSLTIEGKNITYFQHNVLDLFGDYLEAKEGEVLFAREKEVLFIRKHETGNLSHFQVWRPWSLTSNSLSECSSDNQQGNGHFRVRN